MKTQQQYYTQAFSSVRHKSKRRGDVYPEFSKTDLIDWLNKNGFQKLWLNYELSNYDKWVRPSIDRINDYKPYTFDNIQLITWKENHIKGVTCVKHKKANQRNNTKYRKQVFQYSLDLTLIGKYESLKKASEKTNIHIVDIQRVCNKTRKSSHGYYFSYIPLDKEFVPTKHKLSKKVLQISIKDEILIKEWDKISDAAEQLKINASSISSACRGRIKQAGGFIWRYN